MTFIPRCQGDFETIAKYKRMGMTDQQAMDAFDDFVADMEIDAQPSEEIDINEEDL